MERLSYTLKPKRQPAITWKQRKNKKQLAICLQRARGKALVIEGEELLNDPALADEEYPDLSIEDLDDDFNLDL